MNPDNVLVIGDTHEPFTHKHYLDFCIETQKEYRCGTVVHIGDLVDNHALSYHEHNPNGRSPADEMKEAEKRAKDWFDAFPKVKMCKGNHDDLVARKAMTYGIPERAIRPFEEIWDLPRGWEFEWSYQICGVKYEHGTAYSGLYPQATACKSNRQKTVIGHLHAVAGDIWTENDKDCIWGLSVGCGIDRMKYAFWYGKDFKAKPILGCGVVLNSGKKPHFIKMF